MTREQELAALKLADAHYRRVLEELLKPGSGASADQIEFVKEELQSIAADMLQSAAEPREPRQ